MPRHGDESGFTLIEVLVATTIAALLLLPLLRGFSAGLATTTRSGGLTEATLIAQSTLETIGAQTPLDAATSVEHQDGRYHVTTTIHPYSSGELANEAALPVAAYEITVTVDWPEGAKPEKVAIRTLRLGPTQTAATSP
ncbi:MAG TPA: prepilin-type N-terminal cleavage/methylation domain-containing protein [Stellaceae bacterium]|jgi:prepilin-type N-terminal cleavage/methylation domain-containing protein|nr:prepilin-type N-terminal cleavage/methylation domain-containing protein [Stellaceae bacterium]